jgi:hypothetical protein
MAVTAKMYGQAILNAFKGLIDFENDTIKVALCTSDYSVDQDAHDFFNDVTNELAAAGGYTSGGETIANCSLTYTAGTNVIKLDGDNVTWSSFTNTFRYAVIYKSTGTASTSPLIAYVDFGEDVGATGTDYTIEWNAGGIATSTAA